ncbi:MAG TPA: hypothetical protein V6D10_17645 [Trichocoleus sp.]|jgi:hypothetical protein
MSETLNKPKASKEVLVNQAVEQFGGKKSYYQKLSKDQLEAALNADPLVQQCIVSLIEQVSLSAKTNQSVNGRRLAAENKAGKFEGHYKEELQRRTYIEEQYYRVLGKLKQLLEVEESELIKASRLALRVVKQMVTK